MRRKKFTENLFMEIAVRKLLNENMLYLKLKKRKKIEKKRKMLDKFKRIVIDTYILIHKTQNYSKLNELTSI